MLIYDDVEQMEKIKIYDKSVQCPRYYDNFGEFHFSYHYGDVIIPKIDSVEPLKLCCSDFIECVENNLNPRTDGITPFESDGAKHVYHLYVSRVKDRDGLLRYLESKDIGTGIHYPIPIHLQEAYQDLGYEKGAFPITEKTSREIVSLPIYPELTERQIKEVVQKIKEFVS